ncbi:cell division protein ZipA [Vibrio ezurae]|uniref:Cell division protein ZipA n=1 Tax=Vibrio ezurae NBRC 102218 TaxID=1219080 RepID=U3CJ83_9VIBR|nr:cell division protein ZipA [Vibrio ezurae]GAD78283.1 cell division protein ZipA homolog [Vibrio ezurae NBRC 102218]
MQELRIVLIVVGVLAIAGLLIHGLWTNKREQSGRFSDKPLSKLDDEPLSESSVAQDNSAKQTVAPEDDFEVVKVTSKSDKKEPSFSGFDDDIGDPLLETAQGDKFSKAHQPTEVVKPTVSVKPDELPTITISSDAYSKHDDEPSSAFITKEPSATEPTVDQPELTKPVASEVKAEQAPIRFDNNSAFAEKDSPAPTTEEVVAQPVTPEAPAKVEEPEMEVLVLHVEARGKEEFIGSDLFVSMEQNGLHFGPMDIYHRHVEISGTGKVLFSVANMLKPGTLSHDDPATFTTKGLSFFMTLPCYGDPEQNFKIMLHTAQMIADNLSGNVLDDKRTLMTRDRIDAYKRQIQDFVHRQEPKETSNIF